MPGTRPHSKRPPSIWSTMAISSASRSGWCSGTTKPIAPTRIRLVRAPAGDRVERRRRHPAFVGTEMMLDAEAVVEAEIVAELQARARAARSADARSCWACPRHGRSARISSRGILAWRGRRSLQRRAGSVTRRQLLDAGLVDPGQRILDADARRSGPPARSRPAAAARRPARARGDAARSASAWSASRRHRRSGRCPACAGPSARSRERSRPNWRSTAWAQLEQRRRRQLGRHDDRAIDERRLVGRRPRAGCDSRTSAPEAGCRRRRTARRWRGRACRGPGLRPTLPPSAISASAMALAEDRDADVVEGGGDRRVRLVDGDADGRDLIGNGPARPRRRRRRRPPPGGSAWRRTPCSPTSTTWS